MQYILIKNSVNNLEGFLGLRITFSEHNKIIFYFNKRKLKLEFKLFSISERSILFCDITEKRKKNSTVSLSHRKIISNLQRILKNEKLRNSIAVLTFRK